MAPAKKRGRPPKQSKQTDAQVCLCLACGGTFDEAAEIIGVAPQNIFVRMRNRADFDEQVLRARAMGLEIRKMLLEDAISVAATKVAEDPRFTVIAIFTAKAMLKWSDMPERLTGGEGVREVLAKIVERARSLSMGKKGRVGEYVRDITTVVK